MNDFNVPFAAYSALFRAVNDSMFINDRLSNKIVWLSNDKNKTNFEIYNKERLKLILFKEIKSLYNDRINAHNLKLTRVKNVMISGFLLMMKNGLNLMLINVGFKDVEDLILKCLSLVFVKLVVKFHLFFIIVMSMGIII